MRNSESAHDKLPGAARLWACWLLAVAAWAMHLGLSYGLVELYCRNPGIASDRGIMLTLHGFTLLFFTLAVYGAWLAWRTDRMLPGSKDESADPGLIRSRFMARSGLLLSVLLAAIVLVQGIPNLVFQPCM